MGNDLENEILTDSRPYIKDYTKRIQRIVNEYENSISQHLNEDYIRHTKWSDRLADRMAGFGGSWRFIIIFFVFLVAWMTWNTISGTQHFDPQPFILLNLVLSFIAAFQAPVIMMSQNRQEADLLLVSHAHTDHFDYPTLRKLQSRNILVVTAKNTLPLWSLQPIQRDHGRTHYPFPSSGIRSNRKGSYPRNRSF